MVLEQMLKEILGIENVNTADNGKEAVSMAFHSRYDLILMDLVMPGLDGFQASKKIRENTASS